MSTYLTVLKRDDWKCRHCKIRNNLNVHHIVFRSQQGEDSTVNLITLCIACHQGIHDGNLELWPVSKELGADYKILFQRNNGWIPGD